MRKRFAMTTWMPALLLAISGVAWAQQPPPGSTAHEAKTGPVTRTFGTQGGYRTEVTSETAGTLSDADRQQASLLMAQVFEHIDEAREAIDAGKTRVAHQEVDQCLRAIGVIRGLLPRTTIHTRTTSPAGKIVYEDRREVQDERIPLFEAMIHSETLAPITAAKRDTRKNEGLRLVEAQAVATESVADIDLVESQLRKAAKALGEDKPEVADKALAAAQVDGVELRFVREDQPMAEARDAIWLAKRALEENNTEQAKINLGIARERLRLYREAAPQDHRQDVDQMLTQVGELEASLNQEVTSAERNRQHHMLGRWWDQVNSWFRAKRR